MNTTHGADAVKADSYTPPADVARNARRALEVRQSKPESQRGMTPVGIARATQLANRRPVSVDTLQRMVAYFDRHEVDKQGSTWDEQGKGWQAWYGWGGDEGRTWARGILQSMKEKLTLILNINFTVARFNNSLISMEGSKDRNYQSL